MVAPTTTSPQVSSKISDELLQALRLPEITITQLQSSIKTFLLQAESAQKALLSKAELHELQLRLATINSYFSLPNKVRGAVAVNGMYAFSCGYEPKLFRAGLQIERKLQTLEGSTKLLPDLSPEESEKVTNGMNKLARRYKVLAAYAKIRTGKKFQITEKIKLTAKPLLQQQNPIAQLSKENMRTLKRVLSKRAGAKGPFALLSDEALLFELVLNSSFGIQHATNFFVPIANAGRLNSYDEIRRHQTYQSPFSTKGNVDKLGNSGFVFYRVFVKGKNGSGTRYGETKLQGNDLTLFRDIGWVSLHDQLIPISGKGARRFFWGKRLLRMAAPVNIKGKTKTKNMMDGLEYRYRTQPIGERDSMFKGKADAQTNFRKKNNKTVKRSFTDEVFYGKDILPGIALSIIRELECLRECGFREYFLRELAESSEEIQTLMLGELVKGFFRIEGKYPVSVNFEEVGLERLKIESGMDDSQPENQIFHVDNPFGDGRFRLDLTINESRMRLALLKQEQFRLKDELSIARRQLGRKDISLDTKIFFTTRKARLEKRFELVNEEILSYEEELNEIRQYYIKLGISEDEFRGVPIEILQYLRESLPEFVEDNELEINFTKLCQLSKDELTMLYETGWYEVVVDGLVTFNKLMEMPMEVIEAIGQNGESGIRYVLDSGVYTLEELMTLYDEDPNHILYLTTEDLTDLVYNEFPDVPDLLLRYAEKQDVDIDWILKEHGENARSFFFMTQSRYCFFGPVDPCSDDSFEYSEEDESLGSAQNQIINTF